MRTYWLKWQCLQTSLLKKKKHIDRTSSPTPSLRSISAFVGLIIPSTFIVPILLISLSVKESCEFTVHQYSVSKHLYPSVSVTYVCYLLPKEKALCWQDGKSISRTILHCGIWNRLSVCALYQIEKNWTFNKHKTNKAGNQTNQLDELPQNSQKSLVIYFSKPNVFGQ